jgi:hypothetical protein
LRARICQDDDVLRGCHLEDHNAVYYTGEWGIRHLADQALGPLGKREECMALGGARSILEWYELWDNPRALNCAWN